MTTDTIMAPNSRNTMPLGQITFQDAQSITDRRMGASPLCLRWLFGTRSARKKPKLHKIGSLQGGDDLLDTDYGCPPRMRTAISSSVQRFLLAERHPGGSGRSWPVVERPALTTASSGLLEGKRYHFWLLCSFITHNTLNLEQLIP